MKAPELLNEIRGRIETRFTAQCFQFGATGSNGFGSQLRAARFQSVSGLV
jgi:hypothetical protein